MEAPRAPSASCATMQADRRWRSQAPAVLHRPKVTVLRPGRGPALKVMDVIYILVPSVADILIAGGVVGMPVVPLPHVSELFRRIAQVPKASGWPLSEAVCEFENADA